MIAKLRGILTDVFPIETRPNFAKRVFWLKQPDTERYPQHWQLELQQGDVDRLKGIEVGDQLECEVEIRGFKWKARDNQEKIITTLKCTGLKVLQKIVPKQQPTTLYNPMKKSDRDPDPGAHDVPADDDLPF